MLIVRGRLGIVLFDETGQIEQTAVLTAEGDCCGIDIPHGTYHSVVACQSGTVFFEAKAGPYLPLTVAERAPWAPAEGAPEALSYAQQLATLFPAASTV
jgi:cupin fold WbuC family metalloprotein